MNRMEVAAVKRHPEGTAKEIHEPFLISELGHDLCISQPSITPAYEKYGHLQCHLAWTRSVLKIVHLRVLLFFLSFPRFFIKHWLYVLLHSSLFSVLFMQPICNSQAGKMIYSDEAPINQSNACDTLFSTQQHWEHVKLVAKGEEYQKNGNGNANKRTGIPVIIPRTHGIPHNLKRVGVRYVWSASWTLCSW